MQDITGFNEQISGSNRFARPAARKTVARPFTRPVARPAARPAARPVARPAARLVARPAARPVARPAATPVARPAQIRLTRSAKPAARPLRPAKRIIKQAVIKRGGQVIPVSVLTRTTQPARVKAANPIQRSFMPVDLPFKPVMAQGKKMRITNTPFVLPVNVNMIEPAVDAGMSNYYGK